MRRGQELEVEIADSHLWKSPKEVPGGQNPAQRLQEARPLGKEALGSQSPAPETPGSQNQAQNHPKMPLGVSCSDSEGRVRR